MQHIKEIFDPVGHLFSYPCEEFGNHLKRWEDACPASLFEDEKCGEVFLDHLRLFKVVCGVMSTQELEELYTRTFDINPVSSLDLGWHLYGESYDRGVFLVKMRELLRQCGIEESAELPDHLSHALLALGRIEPRDRSPFVSTYLLKALDKMINGFEGKDNPYEHLLLATKLLVIETLRHTLSQEAEP